MTASCRAPNAYMLASMRRAASLPLWLVTVKVTGDVDSLAFVVVGVGADGGCFASALASVQAFGGVLEHPARSYAWPAFDLPKPARGRWTHHAGAWVCEVSQGAYGHRARKLTWLLYVGPTEPPALDWSVPAPTAQVSFCKNHGNSPLPRLSKKEAKASPPAFRDLLLSLARS